MDIIPRDLFLLHTDKKGQTRCTHHRVWDAELFFRQTSDNATREGGSVRAITKQQFIDQQRSPK